MMQIVSTFSSHSDLSILSSLSSPVSHWDLEDAWKRHSSKAHSDLPAILSSRRANFLWCVSCKRWISAETASLSASWAHLSWDKSHREPLGTIGERHRELLLGCLPIQKQWKAWGNVAHPMEVKPYRILLSQRDTSTQSAHRGLNLQPSSHSVGDKCHPSAQWSQTSGRTWKVAGSHWNSLQWLKQRSSEKSEAAASEPCASQWKHLSRETRHSQARPTVEHPCKAHQPHLDQISFIQKGMICFSVFFPLHPKFHLQKCHHYIHTIIHRSTKIVRATSNAGHQ